MTKRFLSLLVCLVMLLSFATAASAAGELKIGVMIPLTGSEAAYGKDMLNAMNLAVSEINAKGGVLGKKFKLVTGDAACDAQQATAAATKLVSAGVYAIVGGYCSGATIPTLKIYGDAGLPMVIVAANSTKLIPANPGNAVLINGMGYHQAERAATLFKELKAKKLAIVHQGDSFSEDLASLTKKYWEKAGLKVVAFEVVNKGEQDMSSLVTRIKAAKPDGLYWTAYYADGALLIKQLRRAGFRKPIAVGDGSNSPKLIELGGKAVEGVYATSNPLVEFMPIAKTFVKNYKAKFGQAPGSYSALAYDGPYVLADAIKRAGSLDKKAVIKALRATNGLQVLTGKIKFTPQAALAKSNFVVLKIKNGKWTFFK